MILLGITDGNGNRGPGKSEPPVRLGIKWDRQE